MKCIYLWTENLDKYITINLESRKMYPSCWFFPQFLNNMDSLPKYSFQNWKLRSEKPLNSSYLVLPSQKLLPCKSWCFWDWSETTAGPLPPWLESDVLMHQQLNIWRKVAPIDTGLVSNLLMLETWRIADKVRSPWVWGVFCWFCLGFFFVCFLYLLGVFCLFCFGSVFFF